MQQVTGRIFAETRVRGCNPCFVDTSAGPVVIDTPQLPTKAVAMRKLVETHGTIQYVINTEHHVDHISATTGSRAPARSSTTRASTSGS
jgi:cyclase